MDTSLPRLIGALLDPLALGAILGSLAFVYMLVRFLLDGADLRGEDEHAVRGAMSPAAQGAVSGGAASLGRSGGEIAAPGGPA